MIGVSEHPAEYPLGPLPLADHGQRLGQPERTDRKSALLALQPVWVTIPKHQLAVLSGQLPGDRANCSMDSGVIPR